MMKPNRLLSLGLMAAGAAATILPLQRRLIWDNANRTVAIALDFDDTTESATRAGVALDDLLHELWHAGATHLTIPEDTLARLMAQGRVAVTVPASPLADQPPLGRWNYLASHEAGLLDRVQAELAARQPAVSARLLQDGDRPLLALGGDLESLVRVGLGFDPDLVHLAEHAGLQPLPRPVSYPWPTAATIERTLAQAADIAKSYSNAPAIVAFQGEGAPGHPGELILGHEMLMHETIGALQRHGLVFAYFAESRHQRGDWFVAKSLAPNVILAHEFTQPQLVPEDMVSAAHRWGLLARERGIRLAVLQMFKVVHATTPRDCVNYVAAVADVLVNREGLRLSGRPTLRPAPVHHSHNHDHGHHHQHSPDRGHDHDHDDDHGNDEDTHGQTPAEVESTQASLPTLFRDDDALPWIALIPAGTATLALAEFLDLPQKLAVPLTLAGLLAPLAIQRLDRPANELEATFRPSYAPKLIALGITATAPLAASLASRHSGLAGVLYSEVVGLLAAAGLAATVADRDYALRVEEVKTYGLDWIVPLAGALAVAVAPAMAAHRAPLAAEVIVEATTQAVVARPAPSRLRRLATALPAAGVNKGRALAERQSLQLVDKGIDAGIRYGERLLQNRLSGPARSVAVWSFRRGASLARRKLLDTVQRKLMPAPDEQATVDELVESLELAELPVEHAGTEPMTISSTAAVSDLALRTGIAAAAIGAGLVLARIGLIPADPLAALDLEHTAEHTHHLSRAQAAIGDARMAISPRPLRKWTFATVAALVAAATAPRRAADVALVAATLGETAFLAGFRAPARPLARTVADRVMLPGTRR